MILPVWTSRSALIWPDDYVSLDDSRLLVHPDWIDRLHALGWTTVDSVMRSKHPRVFRRAEERENAIVDFGPGSPRCYLKRHFARGAWPWLKEWRQTGRVGPAGWLEASAAAQCRRAGVSTPDVVAAGWRWLGRPWRIDSFFLCEALEQAKPADEVCLGRTWSESARQSLINSLADAARRLHHAGLFHRDFYWCHLFVAEPDAGRFDVTLIDLQRVFRPRRFIGRWRRKDLAQFVFSAPPGWLDGGELERWYARYLGKSRLRSLDRQLLRVVRAKAAVYRWREGGE